MSGADIGGIILLTLVVLGLLGFAVWFFFVAIIESATKVVYRTVLDEQDAESQRREVRS